MNNLEMKILCDGCPKQKCKIKNSGSMFGVDFVTLDSEKRYLIVDNPNISWDEIMEKREDFISSYVPKFGKYEIEHYIGYKMMEALFISKNITDLFNSELVCDDSPYNITKVSSDMIKERLLKCFEEVEGPISSETVSYLMFKWKPYNELEEEDEI